MPTLSLTFTETYLRSGLYAPPSLPSGLGTEGAGMVEAERQSMSRLEVGDRECAARWSLNQSLPSDLFTEALRVDEDFDSMPFKMASTKPSAISTACRLDQNRPRPSSRKWSRAL